MKIIKNILCYFVFISLMGILFLEKPTNVWAFEQYKRTVRGTFDLGGTAGGFSGIYAENGVYINFPNTSPEAEKLQDACRRHEECEAIYSVNDNEKIQLHSVKHIPSSDSRKAYFPNSDAEGSMLILKTYRDIFKEKYGITLPDNNAIIQDNSGYEIKGKTFLESIALHNYDIDKTFNKILDIHKENFTSDTVYKNNSKVISHLIAESRSFLLSQASIGASYQGFSESTIKKMRFISTYWYQKITLDEAIIKGNKENIDKLLINFLEYGYKTDAELRILLLRFTGKHGYKKNTTLAVKKAQDILARNKKRKLITSHEEDVLEHIIFLHKLNDPNFTPDFSRIHFAEFFKKAGITTILAKNVNYMLAPAVERFGAGTYSDPFSYHIGGTLLVELDKIGSDYIDYVNKSSEKNLIPGWAEKFALEMVKPHGKYSFKNYGAAATFCLLPSDEEGLALYLGKTKEQKNYVNRVENFISILQKGKISYKGVFHSTGKNKELHLQNFILNFTYVNNSHDKITGTIQIDKTYKFEGTLNKRPFSYATLFFKIQNFDHGNRSYLSILPDGQLDGIYRSTLSSMYKLSLIPTNGPLSLDDKAADIPMHSETSSSIPAPISENTSIEEKSVTSKPPSAPTSTPVAESTGAPAVASTSSNTAPVASSKELVPTPAAPVASAVPKTTASPTAPAPKKPGKAFFLPTTSDTMSLTSFAPDQKPDTCIQVVALNASPLIAVRLESMRGIQASWKTKDVKTKAMGVLAVQHNGKTINAEDASFSLDITKETPLTLCVQDAGALQDANTRMRVIFYHKDNSRSYSLLQKQ